MTGQITHQQGREATEGDALKNKGLEKLQNNGNPEDYVCTFRKDRTRP